MARLARSVYRSNNGHRRGNRAEPQFSRRGNPPPGAPARGRPSSPGQRPSAQSPGKLRSMRAVVSNRMSPPVRDRRCSVARHRRRSPTAKRRSDGWSAGLRPASRGSAKPAPTTLATPISRLRTHASPTAQNHGDMERWPVLPVGASDRHRAGARNPHRRRWSSLICRQRPSSRCRLTTGAPGALRHTDWFRETAGKPRRSRGRARSPHSRTTVIPGRPPAAR